MSQKQQQQLFWKRGSITVLLSLLLLPWTEARRWLPTVVLAAQNHHHKLSSLQSSRRVTSLNQQQKQDDGAENNRVVVSTDIELPFPAHVAYDAFADLPRQPTWSPWLKSVEYLAGSERKETKWEMKYLGVAVSWNAVSTRLERPYRIEWESTSGLKNFGKVHFEPLDDKRTRMKMTMTFILPKFLTVVFGKGAKLRRIIEKRMIQTTLANFRDIVIENDLRESSYDNIGEIQAVRSE